MTPDTHTASVEYATKADLNNLRAELKADMRELRLEVRADIAELKADIANQLRALESSLNKTMMTMLIAMTAIFSGVVAVAKLFP